MKSHTSYPKAKCGVCDSTNIGIRNGYKHQRQNPHNPTVGFIAEDYCKDCGFALGGPVIDLKGIIDKVRLSPTSTKEAVS